MEREPLAKQGVILELVGPEPEQREPMAREPMARERVKDWPQCLVLFH